MSASGSESEEAAAPSPSAAAQPTPETRSGRRAMREYQRNHPTLPPIATEARPVMVVATAAMAALLALATAAHPGVAAVALIWVGGVLAWGWPGLLGSSSRFGSSVAIGTTAVLAPVAVALTPDEPFLRHVPVAVTAAIAVMFVHQLVRRDGRPRLTQSLAVGSSGIALAAMGSAWLPLARAFDGPEVVIAAGAALALGALADLAAPHARLRPLMIPGALVLGAVGGGLVSAVLTVITVGNGALIGLTASLLALVTRRVVGTAPQVRSVRGQITAAAASVLLVGVPVYLVGRLTVG